MLHGACSKASGDGSSNRLMNSLTDTLDGTFETPPALGSALEGPCDDCHILPEALFMRHPHLASNPPPPPPPPPPISLSSTTIVPIQLQNGLRMETDSSHQASDCFSRGGSTSNSTTRGGLFVSAKDSIRDKSGRWNEVDRRNEADREKEADRVNSLPPQKRKFNCPTPKSQDPRQPALEPTSSGGRGYAPSSTSSSGHGKARQQPSSQSPEDELPEKLKGCDPKLVEMIENEILDSGQPVTFSDISGLAEAKQGVYELVCWPMKRPGNGYTGIFSIIY